MEYGGHIAEILHRSSGINPMWLPPWTSIEPTEWNASSEAMYGEAYDGKTLSCMLGHFLCLDTFGMPSYEERSAGANLHGEALLTKCAIEGNDSELTCAWDLPRGPLKMTRKLELTESSFVLKITEMLENTSDRDYPTAWTQHVTLGPPFLEQGTTRFKIPDVRSMDLESVELGPELVSTFTSNDSSGGFVTHLLDPAREQGYFLAYLPPERLLHGYVWTRKDFPWLGVWEEVCHRQYAPWNGKTVARGMEFGVSPFPESRREMIQRGELFDTPCYRWIPAQSTVTVEYCVFLCERDAMPNDVLWDGDRTLTFV
jgi:hypothetical protein